MNLPKITIVLVFLLGCTTTGFADPPTEPGATNEWSFDEGSGNLANDSVGGNNLSLNNWAPGSKQWIDGMYGGALDFNNSSEYAISNQPIAATSGDQFSVSFWMRADVHNPPPEEVLTPVGANLIGINGGVGIDGVYDPNSPLTDVWEDYTVTVDRTAKTASVYRDGSLVASGSVNLPVLDAPWVFGHNQDLTNSNGSFQGALNDVQFYNRVLTPTEITTLAAQPPQPGISATLVVPAQSYGATPTGAYKEVTTTLNINVNNTDWIAWNRFPELRSVSDAYPGQHLLGTQTPEVDDYFLLKVTNPLGQSMAAAFDQNGGLGAPIGQQAMILGTAGQDPIVVRGDNLGNPSFLSESGALNSIFTVSGTYTFSFVFENIGGDAGYPDVYLLTHTVPEPSSLALASAGLICVGVMAARHRRQRRSA